jgi:transcription elongation factor GreA
MHQLGRRVRDLRALLDHVEVIAPPDASRVTIGTRVRLRDCESNEDQELLVSGFDDGDPALRRVSYTAPLAASLLGATIGEQRQVSIAGRVRDFEVLSIVTAQEEFS